MKIATHNGTFHADDVFGVALLKKLYPQSEIIRTRNNEILETATVVLDAGAEFDPQKKRFDHHQANAPQRPNGITYSAFGLLWRAYGMEYCEGNEQLWQRIDEELVQFIDAVDNGNDLYSLNEKNVAPYDISDIIRAFNPLTASSDETFDSQFFIAVDFAGKILDRLLAVLKDELENKKYFVSMYEQATDKRCLILDRYMSMRDMGDQFPELLYVVYPAETDEQWMVMATRVNSNSFELRKPLPAHWASLRGDELIQTTGVKDAVFCHTKRFIAGARSKEGALMLLNLALKS